MKHINELNLLSKFRSEIMGIAILWVFIFHIYPYESNFKYDILKIISYFGYAGVDIFLFVSGFGLYYGYSKYVTKQDFYRKRFIRIIPTYLIFILLTLVLSNDYRIKTFLSLFCNIGWYLPRSGLPYYNWYMSIIMLIYIAFPFYMKLFNRNPLRTTIYISALALITTFLLALFGSTNTAISTTRIPIFAIGTYFGYLLKNEHSINIRSRYIILVAGLIMILTILLIIKPWPYLSDLKSVIIWDYGFYWIPFIIIIPGLLLSVVTVLDFISKRVPYFNVSFKFLGTISLEIYLIHTNTELCTLIKGISCNQSVYFINMLLISIIGGVIIHKIMSRILKS